MVDMTLAEASAAIAYDPASGVLTWLVRKNGRDGGVRPGDIAGCDATGRYRSITVNQKRILAHRLAWLLHYGQHPKGSIDHINGNPSDNRIANLRDVSHKVNLQNRKAKSIGNKSTGLLGSSQVRPGKFVAYVHRGGKKIHLGVFSTPALAHAAHVTARRETYEGNTL